jgi:Zn-dependent protease with chaperone function
MAIASGIPPPRVWVLDEEHGINAFAAGLSPEGAAIGVTRGTMTTLSRDELQGIVAHEFSHILHGDMRLNLRLAGIVYGILFLAIAGRVLLRGARWTGGGRGRRRGDGRIGAAIVILGLGLMIVGAIGVFFGRLIKAALSRQREFLADASAVQYTRNPEGIGGALKIIAAGPGSRLGSPKAEEVSHMLFGKGLSSLRGAWSTHPPIVERIRAIEPSFRREELEDVRRRWERRREARLASEEAAAAREAARAEKARAMARQVADVLDPASGLPRPIPAAILIGAAGTLAPGRVAWAAAVLDSLSPSLRGAAASGDEAPALVLALLLSNEAGVRGRQRNEIARSLGEAVAARVEARGAEVDRLAPEARLPLFELALPALREQDPEALDRLAGVARALILADRRVEPFEFALGKLLERYRKSVREPKAVGAGRIRLAQRGPAVRALLSVLTQIGAPDLEAARAAYATALVRLPAGEWGDFAPADPWAPALDEAIDALSDLRPLDLERLVEALASAVGHDGVVTPHEAELLRAICAGLGVPLPQQRPMRNEG